MTSVTTRLPFGQLALSLFSTEPRRNDSGSVSGSPYSAGSDDPGENVVIAARESMPGDSGDDRGMAVRVDREVVVYAGCALAPLGVAALVRGVAVDHVKLHKAAWQVLGRHVGVCRADARHPGVAEPEVDQQVRWFSSMSDTVTLNRGRTCSRWRKKSQPSPAEEPSSILPPLMELPPCRAPRYGVTVKVSVPPCDVIPGELGDADASQWPLLAQRRRR